MNYGYSNFLVVILCSSIQNEKSTYFLVLILRSTRFQWFPNKSLISENCFRKLRRMASGGNQDCCQFCFNSAYNYIISRPVNCLHRELGFFHVDADRIFSQNKSDLGSLNLPPDCQQLDLDLNVGFGEWENPPSVQQHLDSILFWILCNKEKMTFEDLG